MTSEKILFDLKRSVLEYSLKHRLDSLVTTLACNSKTAFAAYRISPIRFELFNMYIVVKNEEFRKFDSVIKFLNEFKRICPRAIPEKLFVRVTASIKALVTKQQLGYNFNSKHYPIFIFCFNFEAYLWMFTNRWAQKNLRSDKRILSGARQLHARQQQGQTRREARPRVENPQTTNPVERVHLEPNQTRELLSQSVSHSIRPGVSRLPARQGDRNIRPHKRTLTAHSDRRGDFFFFVL